MYVRVARFEGSDPTAIDQTIAGVKEQLGQAPPPGLEGATRVLMLVDRENGRNLSLVFFGSEEELRRGDEALSAMSPEGAIRRTSVELYEVGLDERTS